MTPQPAIPPSRKDRERERHRREILDAAERLFARKGYRAATVDEIAREAEFAVGTLYVLFKDKDDLYSRVIEAFAQEFVDQFERDVLPIDRADHAVAALVDLRLRHYHRHREFIRSALASMPAVRVDPLAAAPRRVADMFDRYLDQVAGLFRRGIARGEFAPADPLYLALALEGTINAFVARWSRHEPPEPLDALVEAVRRPFLEQIAPRPGPAGDRAPAPAPARGEPVPNTGADR